jgi:hypothetical protein
MVRVLPARHYRPGDHGTLTHCILWRSGLTRKTLLGRATRLLTSTRNSMRGHKGRGTNDGSPALHVLRRILVEVMQKPVPHNAPFSRVHIQDQVIRGEFLILHRYEDLPYTTLALSV